MIGEAFIFFPIAMGFLYLLFAPIVFATNGDSMTAGNTLFVFYTSSALLPIAITLTLIGIVFILIGLFFKKRKIRCIKTALKRVVFFSIVML